MSTTADDGTTRLRAAHRRRRATAGAASPLTEDPIEAACEAIASGRPAVVLDGEEGQLVMAADAVSTDWLAFFLRHTSGLISVALGGDRLDALGDPPSVDVRSGKGNGVSAARRAATIRALCDPSSGEHDFISPGSVFLLLARAGGVLERPGHAETSVDLARMAGRAPAGVVSAVASQDKRSLASGLELRRFVSVHGLPVISIADLVAHRLKNERLLARVAQARMPTRAGEFECIGWQHLLDGTQHLALLCGDVNGDEPVLVRVHRECLAGDVLGSLSCDCRARLDQALGLIAGHGRGVCVYVRRPEGRALSVDHGHNGHRPPELSAQAWDTGIAAQVLSDLGVSRARLLADETGEDGLLHRFGIEIVERIGLTGGAAPLRAASG